MSGDAWFERWFEGPYLDLYAHRDTAEAERGTRAILAPLGLAGRRVLDLACGPGRWLRAVTELGAHAVGLDLSMRLLQAARAAPGGETAELVRGDMRDLPFLPASFDHVLCMFTSFGYFATAGEDRQALAEMARVVRPQGMLVLDFLNANRVRRDLPATVERTTTRWAVRESRALDASGERVVKEIELRAGDERHVYREEVRLWEEPQLVAALAAAGFEVTARSGDYDGGSWDSERSPRLVLCARRRSA
jgi:ubiquinone/menaquinone biosynthesis C-methylase UbiE